MFRVFDVKSRIIFIDYIDDDIVVTKGSIIVTSGLGGVFPTGLTVGEVVDVYDHSSGIGRFATVMPLGDIETIQYVFVIKEFENPE